jgi:HSP20 family protein
MKTVTLYRPFNIENALNDFDRYLETFFGDSPLSPTDRIFNHLPAVDIREKEDAYLLEAELPGYDEKGIQVHVDGGALTIESAKAAVSAQENAAETAPQNGSPEKGNNAGSKDIFLVRERRTNAFSRSFRLPENADPNAVSASFKNGILSLEIRKRSEAQKRMIQINAN